MTYSGVLTRFQAAAGPQSIADLTPEVIVHYLADVRGGVRPVSAHKVYRTPRTFTSWCTRMGRLAADPMAGLVMRAPAE